MEVVAKKPAQSMSAVEESNQTETDAAAALQQIEEEDFLPSGQWVTADNLVRER